jgi:hypothetical protein
VVAALDGPVLSTQVVDDKGEPVPGARWLSGWMRRPLNGTQAALASAITVRKQQKG